MKYIVSGAIVGWFLGIAISVWIIATSGEREAYF